MSMKIDRINAQIRLLPVMSDQTIHKGILCPFSQRAPVPQVWPVPRHTTIILYFLKSYRLYEANQDTFLLGTAQQEVLSAKEGDKIPSEQPPPLKNQSNPVQDNSSLLLEIAAPNSQH